jgi:hypothetical protein
MPKQLILRVSLEISQEMRSEQADCCENKHAKDFANYDASRFMDSVLFIRALQGGKSSRATFKSDRVGSRLSGSVLCSSSNRTGCGTTCQLRPASIRSPRKWRPCLGIISTMPSGFRPSAKARAAAVGLKLRMIRHGKLGHAASPGPPRFRSIPSRSRALLTAASMVFSRFVFS